MNQPRGPVVVAGGINIDLHLTSTEGTFTAGSSTPSRLVATLGGVGRNIAENLARLGVPTILLGAVGGDAQSDAAIAITRRAGVDVSRVTRYTDLGCGTYVALINEDGSLAYGAAAMEATDAYSIADVDGHREAIVSAACVVIDANLAPVTIERIVTTCNEADVPVVLEPVSVAKAARLRRVRGDIFLATPNDAEYAALSDLPNIQRFAVTSGPRGATLYDRHTDLVSHHPAGRATVVDETGAGDAFVAGLVLGLATTSDTSHWMRLGVAAAGLAVQSRAACPPSLSRYAVEDIVRRMEGER